MPFIVQKQLKTKIGLGLLIVLDRVMSGKRAASASQETVCIDLRHFDEQQQQQQHGFEKVQKVFGIIPRSTE